MPITLSGWVAQSIPREAFKRNHCVTQRPCRPCRTCQPHPFSLSLWQGLYPPSDYISNLKTFIHCFILLEFQMSVHLGRPDTSVINFKRPSSNWDWNGCYNKLPSANHREGLNSMWKSFHLLYNSYQFIWMGNEMLSQIKISCLNPDACPCRT